MINKKHIIYLLVLLTTASLSICISKFWELPISDEPPSWDSLFNFIAILAALGALVYQMFSSNESEIESTINVLFLDIDSMKFKANQTNGADALRSYTHDSEYDINKEINVVDSLSSILIQFDSLLTYFKNGKYKNLRLRVYTLYYSKIMWASENLILTTLFTYQELAKKYIRISRIIYHDLQIDDLVEPNESFIKKLDLLEMSLNYYNSRDEYEKTILKSTMAHFNLLCKSGKWQGWNHYEELINHYDEIIRRNKIGDIMIEMNKK